MYANCRVGWWSALFQNDSKFLNFLAGLPLVIVFKVDMFRLAPLKLVSRQFAFSNFFRLRSFMTHSFLSLSHTGALRSVVADREVGFGVIFCVFVFVRNLVMNVAPNLF